MAKEKRNYRLTDEEIRAIVAEARRSHRTRTDIVRAGLHAELEKSAKAAAKEAGGLASTDPLAPFLRGWLGIPQ